MSTQLIMTVGTNALPVWVAWYHLKDKLESPPISVRFVHTEITDSQKDLLVTHCSSASFGRHIRTSPGDPGRVRGDIKNNILNGLDESITHLHVHYTGGTQVMGVETVSAIEKELAKNPNVKLDTTYLDARGDKGPRLISRSKVIQSDARKDINVDLNDIALLNGFTLAPFDIERTDNKGQSYNHEYYDTDSRNWTREYRETPSSSLNQNQEQSGNAALNRMQESWTGNNWNDPYIDPTDFEYAAYVALKNTLNRIKTTNSDRSNYKIYHNVYVKRTGANIRDKEFELDVVAILGYQIVVVSCSYSGNSGLVKQKGMEAILRARQLGGDEAQAIVLCKAHPNEAQLVQQELHDEVGSVGAPLRIWGTDKWRDLHDKFDNYLQNDLHWR